MPELGCDVPAGQDRHEGWPAAGWYLPSSQSSQKSQPEPLYLPAAQLANVALVEPAGQKKPALQGPLQAVEVRTEPAAPKEPALQRPVQEGENKPVNWP